MSSLNCHNYTSMAALALLYLADQLFEYWLGKTNKISAGSKVGLIITALASIAVLILRRKENVDPNKGN